MKMVPGKCEFNELGVFPFTFPQDYLVSTNFHLVEKVFPFLIFNNQLVPIWVKETHGKAIFILCA